MAHAVNDNLALSDLVDDQVIANREAPDTRLTCRLTKLRILGDACRDLFYSLRQPCRNGWVLLGDVSKDFVEIAEGTAFIPELHTVR
jgi:hypothetical protein